MTPKEEAMHLEVKALLEFAPRDAEAQRIYNDALEIFFSQHARDILVILDIYFMSQYK